MGRRILWEDSSLTDLMVGQGAWPPLQSAVLLRHLRVSQTLCLRNISLRDLLKATSVATGHSPVGHFYQVGSRLLGLVDDFGRCCPPIFAIEFHPHILTREKVGKRANRISAVVEESIRIFSLGIFHVNQVWVDCTWHQCLLQDRNRGADLSASHKLRWAGTCCRHRRGALTHKS